MSVVALVGGSNKRAARNGGRMVGSSQFEIHETHRRGWARISVSGELDMSTALTFRRQLRALKAANTHVYVDLSQLEFIDAAGAHAVADAVADSRQSSWRVKVEPNMSDQTRRFFDLMKSAGVAADF